MIKRLLCVSGFLLCFFHVSSLPAQMKAAREAKGTETIVCSPRGKDAGALLPIEALSKLKKGMELKLLPGRYDAPVIINEDRVIITGDPHEICAAELVINGKGCIVKGMWVRTITATEEVVVVDSLVTAFLASDKVRGKQSQTFYNSGFVHIRGPYRDTKFTLENCTVLGASVVDHALYCSSNSNWQISNSILFSTNFVFGFYTDGKTRAKLSLKDSLVFGRAGLAKNNIHGVRSAQTAMDLRELKKLCSLSSSGKLLVEAPGFSVEPPDAGPALAALAVTYLSSTVRPENFLLAKDSPAAGMGIIFDEHPSFAAKHSRQTSAEPADEKPLDADRLTELDKQLAGAADKRTPEKKTEEEKADDDEIPIGGVPEAPK